MSKYTPIKQAYEVFEPASGVNDSLTPVIFIHGVFACKESWKDLPQNIADATKRKVYSVDIRNHGDSEWTDEFDFELMANDLLHFMDTIKCSKAILFSCSLGGRIAIKVALEHPTKIEKIVVEEMFRRSLGSKIYDQLLVFVTRAQEALGKIPKGIEEAEAAAIVMNHIYGIQPEAENSIKKACPLSIGLKKTSTGEFIFKTNMKALTEAVKNAAAVMTVSEGLFDGPACFIYGKDSPYRVDKEEEDLKKYFPKAEFVGIDGAKHNVHLEKKQEFLEAALKFLLK